MFRINRPEKEDAIDIAAQTILKGWEAKGEPIQVNDVWTEPSVITTTLKQSTFTDLLQKAYELVD